MGYRGSALHGYVNMATVKKIKRNWNIYVFVVQFRLNVFACFKANHNFSLCMHKYDINFPVLGHYKETIEPCSEKTGLRGFRPGRTQTRLYSNRRWLEA